jgi:hypothetical protein
MVALGLAKAGMAALLFFIAIFALRLGQHASRLAAASRLGALAAGGVLLATALLHMLADAAAELGKVADFPLGAL